MAIASTVDHEEGTSQVILAIVRSQNSGQFELEKLMRRNGFIILQQKTLELEHHTLAGWFGSENILKSPETDQYIGYALQRKNAASHWQDFAEEIGRDICGVNDKSGEQLKLFFPGVVTAEYLQRPEETLEYLNEIKPTLMAGLEQVCAEKPEDPVLFLATWLQQPSEN